MVRVPVGKSKMFRCKRYSLTLILVSLILVFTFALWNFNGIRMCLITDKVREEIVDFSNADNETGFPHMIAPNIVHLVHFGKAKLTFGEMIAIKSAYINHKPDRIIIHCDCYNMTGEYWYMVRDIPIIEIEFKEKPKTIFGKNLAGVQHASDVARLEVLMKYGGIYIDSDVYVVQSLDKYRKFEYTIGWPVGENIGNQIQIAHKNARFLKLYYESYRDYRGDLWYYNGGQLPTKSILYERPYLVHRVPVWFGVDTKFVVMLYMERTKRWRDFYTVHLLLRHKGYMVESDPVKEFDMTNIRTYNRTFGDMAREVLFGSTDFV